MQKKICPSCGANLFEVDTSIHTPNLFEFATSELSQDAFLCWLLSWSQDKYQSMESELHKIAVDFITLIFAQHNAEVPIIKKIEIIKQFKSLDVLAIVNDRYAILIEDKTYTKHHSNQLVRYRESVKQAYPNLIQLPIYYKIADQSHYDLVYSAGYKVINRKMILKVLNKDYIKRIKNHIFHDYLNHLQRIEDSISSFITKPIEDWNHFAWQGFYQELQTKINGEWGYVPNPTGGFWGFWWNTSFEANYYLQLEQEQLCAKVIAKQGENRKELRTTVMLEALVDSEKRGLALQKPSRFGNENIMTVAKRLDYLQTNFDGTIDLERTIEELKKF
ncbi:PD-(D/E)XK nuclease family protein [Bacillus sp. JJ722]|uniref:PD-(D/E)XK nuclease family protein n=1 Tax=Bacillus sp. JJ722 TaxID=3122973 RepID=UPI002FFF98AE